MNERRSAGRRAVRPGSKMQEQAEDPLAAAVRRRLTEADADTIADQIIGLAREGKEPQIKLLRALLEDRPDGRDEAADFELSLELARRVLRVADGGRTD